MKKLICAKDIEMLVAENQKELFVEKDTIFTPSSLDLIKENEIRVVSKQDEVIDVSSNEKADVEAVYEILKKMKDLGLLEASVLADLLKKKKYLSKMDKSGFKLVDGKSISLDAVGESPGIMRQEVVEENEATMNAGFLSLEETVYQQSKACELVIYIVDGQVTITLNGNSYEAECGDVLYIPKDTGFTCHVPNKARLFYTRR